MQANVVIHLTPPAIVELPEYQRWVASLGGAKHVVAGYGHHGLGRPVYISSMRLTAKLNCIAPEVRAWGWLNRVRFGLAPNWFKAAFDSEVDGFLVRSDSGLSYGLNLLLTSDRELRVPEFENLVSSLPVLKTSCSSQRATVVSFHTSSLEVLSLHAVSQEIAHGKLLLQCDQS